MPLTDSEQLVWDTLKIPDPNNFFQRFRLLNDKLWMTRDKRVLVIENMESSHIQSCITMLERCDQTSTQAYRGLCEELTKRGQYPL